MRVIATFYANTGDIEDDITFEFLTPYYLHKGMKVRCDDEMYEVQESYLDCDNDLIECTLKKHS